MELKRELFEVLRVKGAVLCGAADISDVTSDPALTYGVAVAVTLPKEIVSDLKIAPTLAYRDAYHTLNEKLNEIVTCGAEFLHSRGYEAVAQTTDYVQTDTEFRSKLPHKSVAVRAGIGWIGRSGLLITEQFGGAVRLSSLMTNAPLEPDVPQFQNRCGGCRLCVEACPAHALSGVDWKPGMKREELFDWSSCNETQIRRMKEATGIEQDLCGLCFAVCPFTERYLRNIK